MNFSTRGALVWTPPAAVPLNIIAAEGADGERIPTFHMVAYSGGLMTLEGRAVPVLFDLASMTAPTAELPALFEHDRQKILGHGITTIAASEVTVDGWFSGVGPERDNVLALARNGYPWQVSLIGRAASTEFIAEGKTLQCNGQSFTGPVAISRGVVLRGVSFCSVGADPNSLVIAASATMNRAAGEPTLDEALTQAEAAFHRARAEAEAEFNRKRMKDEQVRVLRIQAACGLPQSYRYGEVAATAVEEGWTVDQVYKKIIEIESRRPA